MSKYIEIVGIKAIESMMPGFHKLLKIFIKGKKDVSYLEGFFDGMITMKKIDLGIDVLEDKK